MHEPAVHFVQVAASLELKVWLNYNHIKISTDEGTWRKLEFFFLLRAKLLTNTLSVLSRDQHSASQVTTLNEEAVELLVPLHGHPIRYDVISKEESKRQ